MRYTTRNCVVEATKAVDRANALAARLAVASEVARDAARNARDALDGAALLLRWALQGRLAARNALVAAENADVEPAGCGRYAKSDSDLLWEAVPNPGANVSNEMYLCRVTDRITNRLVIELPFEPGDGVPWADMVAYSTVAGEHIGDKKWFDSPSGKVFLSLLTLEQENTVYAEQAAADIENLDWEEVDLPGETLGDLLSRYFETGSTDVGPAPDA